MSIQFVSSIEELAAALMVRECVDVIIIDPASSLSAPALLGALGGALARLASARFVGPSSESLHDQLDDLLIDAGLSGLMTMWSEESLTVDDLCVDMRWVRFGPHACVLVPDELLRRRLDKHLEAE